MHVECPSCGDIFRVTSNRLGAHILCMCGDGEGAITATDPVTVTWFESDGLLEYEAERFADEFHSCAMCGADFEDGDRVLVQRADPGDPLPVKDGPVSFCQTCANKVDMVKGMEEK